jgi:hypothetical protein
VERDALRNSGHGLTATQEEPTMANEGDPLDFDESERGERQPTSAESSEQHADTVERLERNNAPAGDSVAIHGSGDRDDATAGKHADVAAGESGDAANN